ncbi:MAG: uroporphyrinogen decarboxylase family protein [Candidatus Methanospirareceae archaeon]
MEAEGRQKDMRLKTMTLGSLPVESWEGALSFQKMVGVDIVTCGLPCGGFIDVYASKLPGIRKIGDKFYLGIDALRYAPVCSECISMIKNKVDKPMKAIIPGPATFLSVMRCDDLKLGLDKLSEVLSEEVEAMERVGAEFIQINEPILSRIYPVPRPFIHAINRIANSVRVPTILHVCGDISSFAHYIPRFEVDMVSLEFAGTQKNFDLLTEDLFEGKRVVVGCVSTKPVVEDVGMIRSVVDRALALFPGIILSSDCGFAKTPQDIVIRKMRNMIRVSLLNES